MKVRHFFAGDTAVLCALYNDLHPDQPLVQRDFARYVAQLVGGNGRFWVVAGEAGTAVGYAALAPLPGLPLLAELEGGLVLAKRGRGYGRFLLRHILAEMTTSPYRQLSACVPGVDSPAARFLQRQGFFVEHEEWVLVKEPLAANDQSLATGHWLLTIDHLPTAVTTFLTLYDLAFSPHPWYQPYTSVEVEASLKHPTDLLFVQPPPPNPQSTIRDPQAPIGFAWLHRHGTLGEIEPIGIVPAWQGKGYGRVLLTAALRQLAHRGAESAQITAWTSNAAALRLYHRHGFRHSNTRTYLAFNLR